MGVLIAGFGIFWIGEGLGLHWPGQDFMILGLAAGLLTVSLLVIWTLRRRARGRAAAVGRTLPGTSIN